MLTGNLHFACAEHEDELSGMIYKSTSFNDITDEKKSNNYAIVKIRRGKSHCLTISDRTLQKHKLTRSYMF